MLTYNMDVTPESVWKRTTPSEAELAQPYYCTEAGVFYAQQHFSTARTDKESYLLFYTLRGAGLIEQGESHVVLSTGQALLLNCRTPQSYCTAPGQSCWHHYWVHLDGAGVAAMEPLLLPGKKLTPVQLTGVKIQEFFETVSKQAWQEWLKHQTTLINEKRLNVFEPDAKKFLEEQREKFFNNDESVEKAEGWTEQK
jgi:Fe-S cluster biosynthesis and repair protein YggX